MELFTKAPISEGLYEALVNLNEPEKASVYWTTEHLSLLPPASRDRCIAYYRAQSPYSRGQGVLSFFLTAADTVRLWQLISNKYNTTYPQNNIQYLLCCFLFNTSLFLTLRTVEQSWWPIGDP
jgi:hypothetical protein